MFRTPTDDPAQAATFYESEYAEGSTTAMPPSRELDRLKAGDWPATHNYANYIEALKALGAGSQASLLDFGCSWGYGSYQLRKAGYDVISYEISPTRARYGADHLGVRVIEDFDTWASDNSNSIDVFFSSHVLEHVPSPSRTIEVARSLLKKGGLFVGFFPNGSAPARAAQPGWSRLWGQVHPNFLDDGFLNAVLADRPRAFASDPRNLGSAAGFLRSSPAPAAFYCDDMRGYEMAVAFWN